MFRYRTVCLEQHIAKETKKLQLVLCRALTFIRLSHFTGSKNKEMRVFKRQDASHQIVEYYKQLNTMYAEVGSGQKKG